VTEEQPQSQVRNVRYTAAEDPVEGSGAMRAAATAAPLDEPRDAAPIAGDDDVVNTPVRVDKTPGRNEPCYCGSGKKFKLCHGR
jgi:preprotein translocase subunit SecA